MFSNSLFNLLNGLNVSPGQDVVEHFKNGNRTALMHAIDQLDPISLNSVILNIIKNTTEQKRQSNLGNAMIKALIAKNAHYGYVLADNLSALSTLRWLAQAEEFDPKQTRTGYNGLHASACRPGEDQQERFFFFMDHPKFDVTMVNQTEPEFGNTPLHIMLANENAELAIWFLELCQSRDLKIDLSIQDKYGKTPLMLAAMVMSLPAVQKCLEMKEAGFDFDIDAADEQGRTALHLACLFGQTDMVEALLAAGADPSITDKEGHDASDYVAMQADKLFPVAQSMKIILLRDQAARSNYFHTQDLQPPMTLQNNGSIGSEEILVSKKNSAQIAKLAGRWGMTNYKNLLASPAYKAANDEQREMLKRYALSPTNRQLLQDNLAKLTGKTLLQHCLEGKPGCQSLVEAALAQRSAQQVANA